MSNNPIWDLMYKGESGAAGYNAYNRGTIGNRIVPGTPPMDFSRLTLDQVNDLQHLGRRDPDRVFAVGKYQVIPDTMDGAIASLRLDRNQPFSPQLQDRIFSEYLMKDKRPTVRDYITGRSDNLQAAQLGLAQEWASFPDPYKGGASHYGGANAAHISLQESENALRQLRQQYSQAKERGQSDADAWRSATAVNPGQSQGTSDPAPVRPGDGQTPAPTLSSNWPAPGNSTINRADKDGEGEGAFHTARGGGRRLHQGIDIEGRVGDRIESFDPGRVLFSGVMQGYGQTVVVQHDNGLQSLYAHMDTRTVREGQRVTADTQVGTMGRSGNTPRGGDTHLHFEIRENSNGVVLGGRAVDPQGYLNAPGQQQRAQPGEPRTDAPPRSQAMADGVLKKGDNGPEVSALQQQLNRLGYTGVDGKALETRSGIFGPNTHHAVQAYQRAHGLAVDGEVGRNTANSLRQAADRPLVSENTHPANALYDAIAAKVPGARPQAIANITLQAMENGVTSPDRIRDIQVQGRNVFVMGTVPHERVKVDLDAPVAPMQAMSEHMAKQMQDARTVPQSTQQTVPQPRQTA